MTERVRPAKDARVFFDSYRIYKRPAPKIAPIFSSSRQSLEEWAFFVRPIARIGRFDRADGHGEIPDLCEAEPAICA
jgi:hypothetical protein